MGPSYETKIKEGRGIGEGPNYIPWHQVNELSSDGLSSRIKGLKHNRVHHCLSLSESYLVCLFDLNSDVAEIREQFPLLDIDETKQIAHRLGIEYPKVTANHVLTTDILLLHKDGSKRAIACKQLADLTERQLELFELERQYWASKGVSWHLVTEREMPTLNMCKNFNDLHSSFKIFQSEKYSEKTINDVIHGFRVFQQNFLNSSLPELCKHIDQSQGLTKGSSLRIVKALIAKSFIETDLDVLITSGEKKMKDFKQLIDDRFICKSDLAA